jgi:hypothetical protein
MGGVSRQASEAAPEQQDRTWFGDELYFAHLSEEDAHLRIAVWDYCTIDLQSVASNNMGRWSSSSFSSFLSERRGAGASPLLALVFDHI